MTTPTPAANLPDAVQMMRDNGDGTVTMIAWAPDEAVLAVVEGFLHAACGPPHASSLIPREIVTASQADYGQHMITHVRER